MPNERRKGSKRLRSFLQSVSGTTAVMFALSLPAAMGGIGIASDFGIFNMKYSKLQSAADQAAIAGAKELSLSSADKNSIVAAADSFARSYINDPELDIAVETTIDVNAKSVKVKIIETWTPFFAHFIGAKVTPIVADARAGLYGESKICVLALTPSGLGAVSMTKNSHLRADDCTVYSNSSSASSVYLGDTSSVDAKLVCTVGGVKDNGSLTAGKVVTDCPPLSDPLSSRPPLSFGACNNNKVMLDTGTHVLKPGVYCGGISISGTAVVNFEPGDYVVKDGGFKVLQNAKVHGKNVGFFLTGLLGLVHFRDDATIDLSGRESGPMAGMLIFDDPKQTGVVRMHTISASKATNLTGTIYLPNGNLIVDPAATVGEKSAYTAIVAKRLVVENGPTLVLNTNYDQTPVPVPDGIRAGADVYLLD